MSEERDDQGKWVWAFLLGLIVGALLVVGIGGGLFMVQARQARMAAEEEAMKALEEAERGRVESEHNLKAALEAIRKAEAEMAGKK
jgi:uncharacterized protein HemX